MAAAAFEPPPHWFTESPRKRSVKLSGHTTSISLEEPFWDVLRLSALARGLSLNELIGAIDQVRNTNLSSALRVFALREVAATTAAGRTASAAPAGAVPDPSAGDGVEETPDGVARITGWR